MTKMFFEMNLELVFSLRETIVFIPVRYNAGLIPGWRPANERLHYKVTLSLIGWAQT